MRGRARRLAGWICGCFAVAGLVVWALLDRGGDAPVDGGPKASDSVGEEVVFYTEPVQAPLRSEEELARSEEIGDPGERLEDVRVSDFDESGRAKRVRIVRGELSAYPIRRVETVRLDPAKGDLELVSSTEMVADRVLLRFSGEQSREKLEEVALALGGVFERKVGLRPLYQFRFQDYDLDSVPNALARVMSDARISDIVLYAEPDYIVHAMVEPDDFAYLDGTLWGMDNEGQDGGTIDADIDAPEGWDIRTSSDDIVIAVIDSGVNYLHEDLAANMWVNVEEIAGNGIDDDGNGYVDDVYGINAITGTGDPMDDNGHGTHCSGTIGALGNNGIGVVGVAWTTRIMGVKFLDASGSGSVSDAIESVDYAVSMGADVLSNSWGGGGYSQSLADAIQAASDLGVAFVAAAGNSGLNTDDTLSFPAGYQISNVVSVAAMDRAGNLSSFSNYGEETVDLAAPGTEIESTWIGGTNVYKSISGTSMATPHVSGILALLFAEYPDDSLRANINRLLYSVEERSPFKDVTRTGGRANLANALALVEAPFPPEFVTRPLRKYYEKVGDSVRISVSVQSDLPVEYQWFFEREALVGEVASSLLIEELDQSEVGSYRIDATNEDGTASARFELEALDVVVSLAEAVDNVALEMLSFGALPWDVYFADSVVGDSSIRSGQVTHNEASSVAMSLQGPGELTFEWRVSSEALWDFGEFLIDGNVRSAISGNADWRTVSVELDEAREYRIEWKYSKDGSVSVRQDALFIDNVVLSPIGESAPVILKQPVAAALSPGAVYGLSVNALGESLEYQWFKDGVALVGEVNSGVLIFASSGDVEGIYSVEVSNAYGLTRSDQARIQIASIPVSIVSSPRSLVRQTGQDAKFSAVVAGSLPIDFQWYKDGTLLRGETDAVLEIANIKEADEGEYHLEATNEHTVRVVATGAATLAILDIAVGPRVVKQPTGGHWQEGAAIRLSTAVEGSYPLAYQWYKDGVPIGGANDRSYDIVSASGSDSGVYYMEAVNDHGRALSEEVTIFVIAGLEEAMDLPDLEWNLEGSSYFFSQTEVTHDGVDALQSQAVNSFLGEYFEMSASAVGPTNFALFWKQEVSVIPSYVALYVDDELHGELTREVDWKRVYAKIPDGDHLIRIVMINEIGGTVWLDEAAFISKPVIYRQPQSQLLFTTQGLRLEVDAFGAGPLTYQWFRDNVKLDGKTGSSLLMEGVPPMLEGVYRVVVRGANQATRSVDAVVESIRYEDLVQQVGDNSIRLVLDNPNTWKPWRAKSGNVVLKSGSPSKGGTSVLEGVVEGPGVLVYKTGIQSANCCPIVEAYLDGKIATWSTSSQLPGRELALSERFIRVPEGRHEVRWVFRSSSAALKGAQYALLDDIRITTAPVISKQPSNVRVIEGSRESLVVSMFVEGEYTYQWYHDDVPIAGGTEGRLDLLNISSADAGSYRCLVRNGAGESTWSELAYVDVVLGFYSSVGLDFGEFIYGVEAWAPREDYGWDGDDSLEFVASAAGDLSTLGLSIEMPNGTPHAIRMRVRVQGLGEGAYVEVNDGDEQRRRFRADTDWVEIVLPLRTYGRGGISVVNWTVNKGSGRDGDRLQVWIDAIELVERPIFYTKPISVVAAYGESVEIESAAVGNIPIQSEWRRNGVVLPEVGEDLGLRMGFDSPGVYGLVIRNKVGEAVAEDVILELADFEMGEAIGRPGAVKTRGDSLWELSASDSSAGASSVRVGGLDAHEWSELRFEVRGSGLLSFDWKMNSPSGEERLYCYIEDVLVSALFSTSDWQRFEFSLPQAWNYKVRIRFENANAEGTERGEAWVDRLRFESEESVSYATWAESAFDDTIAEIDRALEADADGDGLVNFVEFALNLDPMVAGAAPPLKFFREEASLRVVLDFASSFAAGEALVGLEASRDLREWFPASAEFIIADIETNSGVFLLEVPAEDWGQPLYVRLAIRQLSRLE